MVAKEFIIVLWRNFRSFPCLQISNTLSDRSWPPLPDVVGVLTEEDVHDGGDQHVDEDEDDEGVELARTPVQGKQLR